MEPCACGCGYRRWVGRGLCLAQVPQILALIKSWSVFLSKYFSKHCSPRTISRDLNYCFNNSVWLSLVCCLLSSFPCFCRSPSPPMGPYQPVFSCVYKSRPMNPVGHVWSDFLRLFTVCFLDQVDGSFGICVVKDDTKISIEPWVGTLRTQESFQVRVLLSAMQSSSLPPKDSFTGRSGLIAEAPWKQ
jgi:hypothetical protein